MNSLGKEVQLWERVAWWPLPPPLRFLAEAELRCAPQDAPLERVVALAGVRYESARREAARAGMLPPGKFVEALRLLRAVLALTKGERVKRVAVAFGFRDVDRFARRMRRHFGLTPTGARTVGALALLERLEREWFDRGAVGH